MNLIYAALAILALAFIVSVIASIPVWLLWNWLIPTLFDLKEISLLEAWGLSLLCSILFKSTTPNK